MLNDRRGRARPERSSRGGSGLHVGIRPSQLSHCKTQREAWVEIARLSGGLVKLSEGAQLLIDAGLSQKSKRETASNGSSWMSNSDMWERVGRGLYRLVGFAADGAPEEENAENAGLLDHNSEAEAGDGSPDTAGIDMMVNESPEYSID